MLFLPFLSNFHTLKQILLMIKLILITESHHELLPLADLKVKYCFAILVYMLVSVGYCGLTKQNLFAEKIALAAICVLKGYTSL